MNILFVCKHNVFRSKVAEAYFKKINKNKNLKSKSAGLIKADKSTEEEKRLIAEQRRIAKSLGMKIRKGSRILKISLLSKQDLIINVADDVPNVFENKFYTKPDLKVIKWNVRDVKTGDNAENVRRIIGEIIKKVNELVKQLENKK